MTPNYNKAANMAYKTIASLQISSLPIDPLEILKKCKNTAVHTYDEIAPRFGVSDPYFLRDLILERAGALTIRHEYSDRVAYELFYDSHANRCRMRFTLAHELGHILLHHHQEEQWEEKEADYFASQLLAPRPVFNLLALYGFDTANPEFIADTFYLSKQASEIAARTPIHQPITQLYRDVGALFETYVETISTVMNVV